MKFSVYDTGEIAMNYQEAMEYMEKVGTYGIVPGLDSIRELCRRLGNPQDQLKFVHIAGTNGKGSTLAYISNILQAAGYRVGKYISPVIIDYCEKSRSESRRSPIRICAMVWKSSGSIARQWCRTGSIIPRLLRSRRRWLFGISGRNSAISSCWRPAWAAERMPRI